jgi:acetyl esterase
MIDTPLEVEVKDWEYLRIGDEAFLARVYQPKGTGPFPAIIDVHGGAWNGGNRENNQIIDSMLAECGFVVAAIDFRLGANGAYPGSIADINAGTRWLKAHLAEFNARPGGIGSIGTSSGGHMIFLSAMRPRDPRYMSIPVEGAEGLDGSVDYIVAGWPIVDPLLRYNMAKAKGRQPLVDNHDRYWHASEEEMAEGNPQKILERGEPVSLPPALIVQGTNDDNVPSEMPPRFAEAYRKAGGELRLELFEGAPHGFIGHDVAAAHSQRALELIKAFVKEKAG